MKNFLLKITEEEKNNILNKHKSVYDGYSVRQNTPNEQPLYIQDLANDKNGITLNSSGNISTYSNKIYMRESKNICSECGMYEEVCECGNMKENMCSECGSPMTENECNECGYNKMGNKFDYVENEETDVEYDDDQVITLEFEDEYEDLKSAVDESLVWFKKFKKYN